MASTITDAFRELLQQTGHLDPVIISQQAAAMEQQFHAQMTLLHHAGFVHQKAAVFEQQLRDLSHQRDQLVDETSVLNGIISHLEQDHEQKMVALNEKCAQTEEALCEFRGLLHEKLAQQAKEIEKGSKRLAKQHAKIESLEKQNYNLKIINGKMLEQIHLAAETVKESRERAQSCKFERDRLVGDLETLAQMPSEHAAIVVLQRQTHALYSKMERDRIAYTDDLAEKTARMRQVLESAKEMQARTDTLEEHFNSMVVAVGKLARKPAGPNGGQKTRAALEALFREMCGLLKGHSYK